MRSARYFAADHGIKLPSEKVPATSSDQGDAEEVETPTSREPRAKADWFLHDDRDEDPGADSQNKRPDAWDTRGTQTGFDNRRGQGQGRRGSGRSEPGRTVPLIVLGTQWHYLDPEGAIQGPFDAKKLLNWVDLGYFGETDLSVRRQGKEDWEKLSEALPTIRKQAAGEFAEPHDRAQEPLRNSFNRNDDQPSSRGRGRSFGRERRSVQEDADILPVMPEGKRHPAEALLSPRDSNEEEQPQRRNNRRRAADASGGEYPSRGRGRGGRGAQGSGRGYSQDTSGNNERLRGRNPDGAAGSSGRVSVSKAAWNLFTAESRRAADEPVWQYVDPENNTQGPFTAKEMHSWLKGNYLQQELLVCGMSKDVAASDVPRSMFKQLGQLLHQAEQGQRFRPVQQKDLAPAPQQAAAGQVLVVPRPVTQQAAAQRAPRQRGAPRQAAPQAAPRAAPQPTPQAEARQPSGQHESAEASASAQPAPPETTAVASPTKSKAGSSSGSNDEAESVVARSNASDDSEEGEGEIRGRDAATDEDSDNGDANEDAPSTSTAAEPLQAHGAAVGQANSGNADKAPASDTDQIPTSSSAGAAVTGPHHASVTEAEQAPTTDTDLASASGTQASPAEADQPTIAGADKAPTADTDSTPTTTGTRDFSSSPTVGTRPDADMPSTSMEQDSAAGASHTPAGDSKAASTSDAGQGPAPSATGPDTSSAADIDRDIVMESVDKGDEEGTAATEGGDSGGQAEPSKGDKTAASTVQAEAPPTSTIAGAKPKTDDSTAEQAMQIDEVTQAEADASSAHKEEEHPASSSSPGKTENPGIMQSMIDTAKTLLGGKTDEEVADDAKASGSSDVQHIEHLDEPSQSYVIEPETESENAESVTYSDHQAAGDQQEENHSKAASVTSVDQEQDVPDLQTGMQNVRIEEPVEDAGEDARSNSSHASAQSHHNLSHSYAESQQDTTAAIDIGSATADS